MHSASRPTRRLDPTRSPVDSPSLEFIDRNHGQNASNTLYKTLLYSLHVATDSPRPHLLDQTQMSAPRNTQRP